MRDLNHQLKELCQRNRGGSFATQADRERLLNLCANDLTAQGFQHLNAASLKPKHVAALLDKWKQDGVSTGTLKNRMSALRCDGGPRRLARRASSRAPTPNTGSTSGCLSPMSRRPRCWTPTYWRA